MTVGWALVLGAVLLVTNAFFVSVEFALVASRSYRLERRASNGSAGAKAALRGRSALSLMLAGTQLGITLCTLGIGAVAEPALGQLLASLFGLARIPDESARAAALVIGVGVVVVLHMVIGEMVPKSWAISHPETAASYCAVPFMAFAHLVRPAIALLNAMANGLVRLIGVTPVTDTDTHPSSTGMRVLLAQSRELQDFPIAEYRRLTGALELEEATLGARIVAMDDVISIAETETGAEVQRRSQQTGRSRLVVLRGERPIGIVHVHDALQAARASKNHATVTELMREVPVLPASLPLIDVLAVMRAERAQLAFVRRDDASAQSEMPSRKRDDPDAVAGIVAMEDLLEEVLGRFEDETDVSARSEGEPTHRAAQARRHS